MSDGALTQWSSNYWENRATLLDGEQAGAIPRITDAELFAAVVACVDDFWCHRRQRVRMYQAGAEIDVRSAGRSILPQHDDDGFRGYHRRAENDLGLRDYALVIADWHQFDRALWDRLIGFVAQLAESVGISHTRMDTQVFLGSYRATPFGVHVDPVSALHVPVIGTKTMRFWDASFAAAHPALQRALDYDRFVEASTVITARCGEAIYWPSDHWHVGESDGSFSVAWGLGYWIGDGIRDAVLTGAMRKLGDRPRPSRRVVPDALGDAALTPLFVDELLGELRTVATSREFRQLVAQSWLEHYSAFGFLRVPAPIDVVVARDSVVRRKPPFRLLASSEESGLVIAAAGCSRLVPDAPATRRVVDRLNQDAPATLADLEAIADPDRVGAIVDLAVLSGAFTVEDH
jgi:hypothetical protein